VHNPNKDQNEKKEFIDLQAAYDAVRGKNMNVIDFGKLMNRDSNTKWLPELETLAKYGLTSKSSTHGLSLNKIESDFRFHNYLHAKYPEALRGKDRLCLD
jgi:hypothetical protein